MSTTMMPADATVEFALPSRPEPPRPKESRLRKAARVTRTVIVVLLLLAAAVLGGGYLVRERIADRAFVEAGTAVLSAEPIAVGSADAGVVSRTYVTERQNVAAGDKLAQVTLTADGTGRPQVRVLRAPQTGVVTRILPAGQAARPGEPVATLYDPAKLVFSVDVPLETLRRLRLGMRAYVSGPGVPGRLATTIASVEPKVDGTAGPTDGLTVVLARSWHVGDGPDAGSRAAVRGRRGHDHGAGRHARGEQRLRAGRCLAAAAALTLPTACTADAPGAGPPAGVGPGPPRAGRRNAQ